MTKLTTSDAGSRQTEQTQARGALWLGTAGLRPTRQRVALAALLVGDGEHRHVTAESLFAAAQEGGERVSLATVYNTLHQFTGAGLLREVVVDSSRTYFDTNIDDHHHFFVEKDGTLMDIAGKDVTIGALPPSPEGMDIARVDVIIRLQDRSDR